MKRKFNLLAFSIILIIICVVSYTGVIISLLSSNINFDDLNRINININSIFNKSYRNTYNIDSTESNSLDGIDTINLNFLAGNINISTWNSNEVSVKATGSVNTNDSFKELKIEKYVSDNQITFSLSNEINTLFDSYSFSDMYIEIFLPQNYNKNLNLSSTSSYIKIENNDFNSMDIKTISGDIDLSNINSKSISTNSTSGHISYNNIKSDSSVIGNVSGGISAQNFTGNMDCKTVSGDINIDFNTLNNEYKFSTVSGYTSLLVPSKSSFSLDSETLSGSIINDFGSSNNSNTKIKFNSTSGDLSINQK